MRSPIKFLGASHAGRPKSRVLITTRHAAAGIAWGYWGFRLGVLEVFVALRVSGWDVPPCTSRGCRCNPYSGL